MKEELIDRVMSEGPTMVAESGMMTAPAMSRDQAIKIIEIVSEDAFRAAEKMGEVNLFARNRETTNEIPHPPQP